MYGVIPWFISITTGLQTEREDIGEIQEDAVEAGGEFGEQVPATTRGATESARTTGNDGRSACDPRCDLQCQARADNEENGNLRRGGFVQSGCKAPEGFEAVIECN